MLKQLTRHGNSTALVLDRTLLKLLGLEQDSVVEIQVEGGHLIISPARDEDDIRTRKFNEVQDRVHKRYAKTFERLAQ